MATVTESADSAGEGQVEAPPQPPTWYAGGYAVVAPIAAGGGGTVWLARDTATRATVAVKFLHPEAAKNATLRRRFLREAEFAASIHHPNVVEVVEVGEAAGHPYLVMPFVDGTTLRRLLARGPLPLDVTVTIVADALRGLAAAHDARGKDGEPLGLVHRDISPHNLLVSLDGTTKLTDFGIARPALKEGVSTTRWAQGKVSYFSPEQGRGEPLDRRSDVFAMGIVLWECLTGQSLFRADDPFVTAHRVQTVCAAAPSTTRRGLPPEFDEVVATALAKSREQRYATAALMLDALSAAASRAGIEESRSAVAAWVEREGFSPAAAEITTVDPAGAHRGVPRRRRYVVALSGLVLAGVVGGAFASTRTRAPAAPSAESATAETAVPPVWSPSPTASVDEPADPVVSGPPAEPSAAPLTSAPVPSRSKKNSGTPRRRDAHPRPSHSATEEHRLPSPTNPF